MAMLNNQRVIQKPSKFGRSYWVLDMLICSKVFAHSRAD